MGHGLNRKIHDCNQWKCAESLNGEPAPSPHHEKRYKLSLYLFVLVRRISLLNFFYISWCILLVFAHLQERRITLRVKQKGEPCPPCRPRFLQQAANSLLTCVAGFQDGRKHSMGSRAKAGLSGHGKGHYSQLSATALASACKDTPPDVRDRWKPCLPGKQPSPTSAVKS